MKGTEKQIAWAEDIISALNWALEETKADPKMAQYPPEQVAEATRRTQQLIDIISAADYAGDIIEVAAEAAKHHGNDAWDYLGAEMRTSCNPLAKALREAASKPL